MINPLLQIRIDCKIQVIPRLGFDRFLHFPYPSPVIHVDDLIAAFSVKRRFHRRFNANQTYGVINIIFRVFLLQFF